jgi:hypothetical protein
MITDINTSREKAIPEQAKIRKRKAIKTTHKR